MAASLSCIMAYLIRQLYHDTLAYYAAVVKQMGELDTIQKFARLFMFPGVYHCGGGYGPSHFDMVTTITAWVEHGTAPNKIRAIQYSSDGQQQQQQSGPTPSTPMTGNKTSGQILPTGGNPISGSGKVIRTLQLMLIQWFLSSPAREM
jgi:hypothetical protein